MDMLETWWPVLLIGVIAIVVIRRLRGEPLDLKDAAATPLILLIIGAKTVYDAHPTPVDLAWLSGLGAVGLAFGAARSASTIIEKRDGRRIQRYRWWTFGLMLANLVVSAGLSFLAQRFGMHAEARPLTLSIGIGLAGESIITLLRAHRMGVPMPWAKETAQAVADRTGEGRRDSPAGLGGVRGLMRQRR